MRERGSATEVLVVAVIALIVLALPLFNLFYVYGTQQTRSIKVISKERITQSSGNSVTSKYLVFTKNAGVFENTDSFLKLKFNSADVYGSLEEGKVYSCDTYGWRIPFLSTYPNIVSCKETK